MLVGTALGAGLVVGIGGWPGSGESALLIGFPDCESAGSALIRQPTLAWTSLSFVPLGVWVSTDRGIASPAARWLLAATIAAVGVGSFLAHAALTDWARQLDSAAIKLMLVAFIAYPVGRLRSWEAPALLTAWAGAAGAVLAIELVWPGAARILLVVLAATAAASAATTADPRSRRWLVASLAWFTVGGAVWWLGRRGGPLCAPYAVFQLHAVWHILAAAGIASLYQIYRNETI